MFTKLFDSLRSRVQSREAERVLRSLSDAALDDIGLIRAGIPALNRRSQPARQASAATSAPLFSILSFPGAAQTA